MLMIMCAYLMFSGNLGQFNARLFLCLAAFGKNVRLRYVL